MTCSRITEQIISEDAVTIKTADNNIAVVKLTPLSIEFYHNDVLESVFEGNRIIFENVSIIHLYATPM